MTAKRKSTRLLTTILFLGSAALFSCNEDDENCAPYDPDALPAPNVVIRVYESNYYSASNLGNVPVGSRVEWQNWFKEPREVISGDGPDDPHKGELFSATLLPYCSGDAIGGRFQMVFTEPDTIHFFNTLVPDGYSGQFDGTLIIRP